VAKIIPIGATDCSIIFSCAGVSDNLAVSIGVVSTPEISAESVSLLLHSALVDSGLVLASNMMTAYTYVGVEARKMTATGLEVGFTAGGSTGTIAQPPCPVNCAVLVTKLTGSGGRQNRGRLFWPMCDLDESSIDPAGRIVTATLANRQGRWNLLFAAFDTYSLLPVIFHNTKPDGSMPVITEPTTITGFLLDDQIATQRRRMR